MNNIRVKQKSLNDWRSELIEESKCDCNCGEDPCVTCGGNCHDLDEGLASKLIKVGAGVWAANKAGKWIKKKGDAALDDARKNMKIGGDKRKSDIEKATGVKLEHIEGGISVQNVADGLNFNEIETIDIIKPQPIKGASNWRLEMVTESLISEGYNDKEIVTLITEGSERDLGWTALLAGGIKNTLWAGKKVYDAGRGTRSIVNRAVKDSKLTKDIFDTAKKLRNPDGISVTKNTRIQTPNPSKGGGLVKNFKGFMQNVKDAGSNLATRTKGKLDRINAKKAEIQTTAKDVDVLGGAATNKTAQVKPMKNITPSSLGDKITGVTNKIKTGAVTAAGGGIVAGSQVSKSLNPNKEVTGLTNNGNKDISPDKNPIISKQDNPTEGLPSTQKNEEPKLSKRELRNKRNEYLSSPEGRRARRDAKIKNRPTGKTKWVGKNTTWKDRHGNVIAPKVTTEGAYQGGGTIIDPSRSRNKFGLPGNLKPGGGGIKDIPLTPTQNRMLVKKKTKNDTKVG